MVENFLVRKKINYHLTLMAAFFIFISLFLFLFLLLGFGLAFITAPTAKFVVLGLAVFLAAGAISRAAAIISLEGWASGLHGLKVLIGDFFFVLIRPKLWKLVQISFYFPYHLARWENQRLEIKKYGLTEKDLIYGETPYYTLARIIKEIRPGGGEDLFVDLGSGIGKTVFLAALNYGLPALGIEINPPLFKAAMEIKEKLKIKKAVFIGGHVLDEDFSEGTIVFFHGTSWNQDVLLGLIKKFEELKPGALVLSVSHQIMVDYLKFVKMIKIDLNWGVEPLYIYQRMD
jgi:hypothetical protein